jgi:hypothetical protein
MLITCRERRGRLARRRDFSCVARATVSARLPLFPKSSHAIVVAG